MAWVVFISQPRSSEANTSKNLAEREYMKNNGMQVVKVKLLGMGGILFDRFIDMSSDKRPQEQKMYLNDNNEVTLPSENIFSFLFGENPGGCAQRFEGKQWKQYKLTGMSHVTISPEFIPFTRSGSPIKFSKFVNEYDKAAKIRILHHKANVVKGKLVIPSPKIRPVLETPWSIEFDVTVFTNPLITVEKIQNWFIRGGVEVALGTYRPRFGRFTAEFKEL